VIRLQSPYAIRLYEWLVQWIGTGELHMTLEDFRTRLDLGQKYPRFTDLRKYVLQPSIDSINLHTNLELDWEPIREKRKVVRLLFVAGERKQGTLEL
jgi:plasmid replication initiation protein